MPLRLAKGKLKSEHCTCVQHLLTHRRHSRTCLAILDSPDNEESCSVLWRGQLLAGSFSAVRRQDRVEGFPLQMLLSSPCQVCPGAWLPKYLRHLHLQHMGAERGDLCTHCLNWGCVGEQKLFLLKWRSSGVARARYQAGACVQIHEGCRARCARQGKRFCIRSSKKNNCRKHYVNISSWCEIYSLWQCLCHSLFVLEHLLKTKLTDKNFYRSSKGQATITRLESKSCIYDGWGLMLKRAQASGMWLMQYRVTSFSNGKRSHFRQ